VLNYWGIGPLLRHSSLRSATRGVSVDTCLLAHPPAPFQHLSQRNRNKYVSYDVWCCQLCINHAGRSNGRCFGILLRMSSDRNQIAFLPTLHIPEPIIVSTNSSHFRNTICFYQLLIFPNHYLFLPSPR